MNWLRWLWSFPAKMELAVFAVAVVWFVSFPAKMELAVFAVAVVWFVFVLVN